MIPVTRSCILVVQTRRALGESINQGGDGTEVHIESREMC